MDAKPGRGPRTSRWPFRPSSSPLPLSPRWLPPAALLSLAGGLIAAERTVVGLVVAAVGAFLGILTLHGTFARLLAAASLAALALAGTRGAPVSGPELPLGRELLLRGILAEDPRLGHDGPRALVDLTEAATPGAPWSPLRGRVYLQVRGSPDPPPAWGDAVVFRARLRPPWGLRNPGGSGFAEYLERRGVSARASAPWPGGVAFAAPGPGTPAALRARRGLAAAVTRSVPGAPGALLRALVLGDRSALGQDVLETFRNCGTAHLIAISGLHLGLLALLLTPPLRWTLARATRLVLAHPVEPLARALTLPALVAYGGLAGFQPSTLRALVMTGLVLTATALSRPVAALPLLSATALLLGLADPAGLADPGLHLSFAALGGLFWLAPALEHRLTHPGPSSPLEALVPPSAAIRWLRAAGRAARRVFCASAGATLATVPLVAYHFGAASPLGLVVNPVAVPLVGFFCLPLGLAGAVFHPLWPAAARLLWGLAGVGLSGLLRLQGFLSPFAAQVQTPSLASLGGLAAAGCLVGALTLVVRTPPHRRAAGILCAAGLVGLLAPSGVDRVRQLCRRDTTLWVFDVGQGQAIGIALPGGAWALVDAGGAPASTAAAFDMGERVVVPALRALGCRRLTLAVSTHPHPDHLAGLPAAVRWGRAAEVWLPGGFAGDARYGPVLAEAAAAGSHVAWIGSEGAEARFGGASVEARWFPGDRENDRSLVLWLRCAGKTALLPADLEIAGQRRLLADRAPLHCDVLVAPHHGAANALFPPFLAAASPTEVLASAGGRPGLPAEAFEAAVQAAGAEFRTTYREGCLRVRLGNGPVRVAAGAD